MRTPLRASLGLEPYDIYGLSEVLGPGVAMECAARSGLHIWEDAFLVEVLDPQSGVPVADGEPGELTLTTLGRECMPLLRYRTGDVVSVDRSRCDCGRWHLRMSRVHGRTDDMLVVRGVNVFPSEIERLVIERTGTANYMIELHRSGPMDALVVLVETEDAAAAEAARRALQAALNLRLEVRPVERGSLPRSEGKLTRVRDLRS